MINVQDFKVDTNDVNPISISLLQGEAVEFHFTLYADGKKISLVSSAEVYYRHDDMEDGEWYRSSAQVSNGVVIWNWNSSLDVGARRYAWFVRAKGTGAMDVSYRALGKFNMLKSPNFTPNELELPVEVLDFATIEVKNSPYYSKSQIDSELDAIDLRLQGHDEEIDALREEITGDAEETLKQHEENYNNPHRVKATQLVEKSPTGGEVLGAWNASNNAYYFDGYVNYYFDTGMYNEGQGAFRITIPNGLSLNGVDLGGQLVEGICDWEFVTDHGNWSGYIYRSKTTFRVNGLDLYVFASINLSSIIQKENLSTPIWVGVGLTKDPNDYSNTLEVVTAEFNASSSYAPINTTMYNQSGTYQVLTEAMLRDKVTGKAYTMCVENGELKLQEYRTPKYEA